MSFWIELHCDAGQLADASESGEGCLTRLGQGPRVRVWTRDAARSAMQGLIKTALKERWSRVHTGWLCPICSLKRQIRPTAFLKSHDYERD